MSIIKLTPEELKTTEKTLQKIVADMQELYDNSSATNFKVTFDLLKKGKENWQLSYNDYVSTIGGLQDYCVEPEEYQLSTQCTQLFPVRKGSSPLQLTDPLQIDRVYRFLSIYDEVRVKIIEELRKADEQKKIYSDSFETVVNKYVKDATIEVELPPSQNAASIKVTEENGNTIGVIKMGSGTIRIITKGNILLEKTPTEEEKIKKI